MALSNLHSPTLRRALGIIAGVIGVIVIILFSLRYCQRRSEDREAALQQEIKQKDTQIEEKSQRVQELQDQVTALDRERADIDRQRRQSTVEFRKLRQEIAQARVEVQRQPEVTKAMPATALVEEVKKLASAQYPDIVVEIQPSGESTFLVNRGFVESTYNALSSRYKLSETLTLAEEQLTKANTLIETSSKQILLSEVQINTLKKLTDEQAAQIKLLIEKIELQDKRLAEKDKQLRAEKRKNVVWKVITTAASAVLLVRLVTGP